MSDILVYRIGKNLYLNLTNRCTNRCTFCVREQSARYEGYELWLTEGEPSAEALKRAFTRALEEMRGGGEEPEGAVFCGYGEPTLRLDVMLETAEFIHGFGFKTRVNTNGHGSLYYGRNIAPELKGKIDSVNVSLNAPDEESYNALCRPQQIGAFAATVAFARQCKEAGVPCLFSVVDCIPPEQLARCRHIAEEVGVPLRVREYIENA